MARWPPSGYSNSYSYEHKWEHPHKNSLPSFSRVYDSYIRLADLCFLNIADILSTTMSLTSIVPVSEVRLNTLCECLPLEPQRRERQRGKSGGWRTRNLIHNNVERSINSFNVEWKTWSDSFHIKLSHNCSDSISCTNLFIKQLKWNLSAKLINRSKKNYK